MATWKLISQFREDGNSLVLKLATPPVVMLSLFNVAVMADSIQKFLKFSRKRVEVDTPEDIQESVVRALSSQKSLRSMSSFFPLTTSQKQWAKIRGAVLLGAFSHKNHKKLICSFRTTNARRLVLARLQNSGAHIQ